MRSPTIVVVLATLAIMAVVPMIESTEAVEHPSEPAEVYFFVGGTCVAQIYVLPDSNIHPLPELPAGYTCWARNDTHEVVTVSTHFSAGSHLIVAFKEEPAPWPADGGGSSGMHPMAIVGWCILGFGAVGICGYYLYKHRR